MAEGVFSITELQAPGDPSQADLGERFEWTADTRPTAAFTGAGGGGARACPVKPWLIGGHQANVRTDYPNATVPSYQIMGPRHAPQAFNGRWDDRYNGAGYAEFEARRFEAMCERGNPVRVQFGSRAYEGIITVWEIDFGKPWRITYEFTLDVANRPEQSDRSRAPETPSDPVTLLDDLDIAMQAMLDADGGAPRHAIAGTLADDVTTSLVASVDAREQLAATIDQRDVNPPEQPVDGFTRIATQFRAAREASVDLLVRLAEVRADVDMSVRTALGVLDFEDWVRSLRFMARLTILAGIEGDRAATERAEPEPVRLYRPNADEHLYTISRKFYGTPHGWSLIYERNSLRSFKLTGNEILIIPERGGA